MGNLRFSKPEPHGPFKNGMQRAVRFGAKCAQVQNGVQMGEENCLFLNIFTPGKRENNQLKVGQNFLNMSTSLMF